MNVSCTTCLCHVSVQSFNLKVRNVHGQGYQNRLLIPIKVNKVTKYGTKYLSLLVLSACMNVILYIIIKLNGHLSADHHKVMTRTNVG